MTLKLDPVRSVQDLMPIVAEMKAMARAMFVKTAPDYSNSVPEAISRAFKDVEELGVDPHLRFLYYGKNTIYTVCLSVDAYEEGQPPRWHLSISEASAHPEDEPKRAPDSVVRPIATLTLKKYKEGSPEGAFKNVRHFFAPFELS